MMISRARFFFLARERLFGRLSQRQVDGLNALLDACGHSGLWDKPPEFAGTILGTAYGEVGSDMWPVREGFKKTDIEARQYVAGLFAKGFISYNYAAPHANGHSYYGRGVSQLTHYEGYRRLGDWLGEPLVSDPDRALDLRVSAEILVQGSLFGLFTDKSLSDYLPDDLRGVRRVVNGLNRADEFARYNRIFTGIVRDSLTQGSDNTPHSVEPRGWRAYLKRIWLRFKSLWKGTP